MKSEPVKVFISYSHRDAHYLEELRSALRPLEQKDRLELWDDTIIRPGERWSEELRKSLNSSQIIVLLLSSDLLSSNFWLEEEWPLIFSRMGSEETAIIPILAGPARLPPELSALQVLPKDGRPISSQGDRYRAWLSIADEIDQLADRVRGESPSTPIKSRSDDSKNDLMVSRRLNTKLVVRALKRAGFYVHRRAGAQYVLRDDSEPSQVVVVPRKAKDIRGVLLRQILSAANISYQEFQSLLEGP